MIDVKEILKGALDGAPLSLVDDPTAWSVDDTSLLAREEVASQLSMTARDNAMSALARAFGKEAERIATAMDVAITEDGPLADLAAIWNAEISGVDAYPLDATPILDAADWEGRVEALRGVMANVVERVVTPDRFAEPAAALVDRMIELDPRLEHLKAEGDFTPPAFLGLDPADAEALPSEAAEAEDQIVWDDEPAAITPDEPDSIDWDAEEETEKALEPAAPQTGRRGRGRRNGQPVPKLCGLLEAAGFADKEIAALLGIDKSTYSLMRSGKRPWQGLRDEQAKALDDELRGRAAAIEDATKALDDPAVRRADNP